MDYLRILLFGLLSVEKIDSNNYRIARYILENINSIEKISNTSLAKACNVSKSSITRFCKDLGLEDLLDLQILYRSSPDPYTNPHKYNVSYEQYLPTLNEQLSSLNMDNDTIEELTDLIYQSKVYVFGHMNSANAALALQYDLLALDKVVDVISNVEEQKRILTEANENDLILIFTAENRLLRIINARNKIKVKAKVYQICNVDIDEPLDYVTKYISLGHKYNYATSLVQMVIFSNMLTLKYKEKYCD